MTLGELQHLLALAIEAPGTPEPGALARSIVPHPPLDAVARTGIYADMYRARLQDALRSDFPNLARLVGDEGFSELAWAYGAAHPSASSDIGQFGQALADFLEKHPGTRGDEADLARLEWALAQAFTAKDAKPVRQQALGRLGEAAAEARLAFAPSLSVLVLSHDVLPLWQQLEAESEELPELESRPVSVAVWRKGFQVLHRALSLVEKEALERARGGASLALVCEAFSEAEDARGEAFRTLAAWFQDGWVTGVESA